MVQMSMKDMEVFLSEPRNATFATVSPNQSPQLTTVWFLYEQKIFYFGIERSSVKHKNIKKIPMWPLAFMVIFLMVVL